MLRLNLLACTIVLLILNSSCTMQKRLYRPGFFVQSQAGRSGQKTANTAVPQQTATAETATATGNHTGDAVPAAPTPEIRTAPVIATQSTAAAQPAQPRKKEIRRSEKQSRKAIKQLVKKKSTNDRKPIHEHIVWSCVCLALGILGAVILISSISATSTLNAAVGLLLLALLCVVVGVFGAFGLSAYGLIQLKMGDDAKFGGYILGLVMLVLSAALGAGIIYMFAK